MANFISSKSDQSVDHTQGFGSFDFAPYTYQVVEDGPSHEKAAWETSQPYRNENNGDDKAWPRGSFPFMKLPPELRRSIYSIFVDALRGGRKDDSYELGLEDGIRFRLSDTPYEPDSMEIDYNLVVSGPPEQRNVNDNQTSLEVINILNSYMAIQAGKASNRQIPSGWNASSQADEIFDHTSTDEADSTSSDSDYGSEPEDASGLGAAVQNSATSKRWFPTCRVWVSRSMSPKPGCYHSCGAHYEQGSWTLEYKSSHPSHRSSPPYSPPSATTGECYCPAGNFTEIDYCKCSYRQRSDYDDVRNLATAHPQVARELGEMLWSGATLDVEDLEAFPLFAAERPEVLSRLSALVLRPKCCADTFDTVTSELEAVCKIAELYMNLRVCTVVLSTPTTEAEYKADVGLEARAEARLQRLRGWAPLFRGLRVRERFDLQVQGMYSYLHGSFTEAGNRRAEELRVRILEMWLPASLQLGSSTEESRHLCNCSEP